MRDYGPRCVNIYKKGTAYVMQNNKFFVILNNIGNVNMVYCHHYYHILIEVLEMKINKDKQIKIF